VLPYYAGSVEKMARKAQSKNWLGVGKIGEYCLVSTATVRRWIKTGDMTAIRLPSGHYRVSIADFKDFLKRYDIPVGEELKDFLKRYGIPVGEELFTIFHPPYEMSELETKLLEAIRNNLGGATLVQLAERLEVAPVVAGRAARSLLDAGKIRKEGNRYYPENSEKGS